VAVETVVAESAIEVRSPTTGEVVGTVPEMASEIPSMVARAHVAQQAWGERPLAERVKVMAACRRWLVANRDAVLQTTMSETGKNYEDAFANEVVATADTMRFWEHHAHKYLDDEKVRPASILVLGRKFVVRHRPRGVIGVIAPWNYPVFLGVGDAVPALVAGNAVILKPSEVTPLTTSLIVAGFAEAGMPQDVFQVATGTGVTGAALVDHVDMIQFTGSTRTGRAVAMRAAERLIPSSLELGGKDPMIVCADANIERAVNAAATMGLLNSGQICMSVERIYVEEPVYDEFVGKLTEAVGKIRLRGDTKPGEADVGAMTFKPQLDVIDRHVKDAVERGAKVLTGGKRVAGPGLYYEPTVLVDVNHEMACMREETFGPTLPVMKVSDVDEAVKLANDTSYGLSSSVYTGNLKKGEAIARRLSAGNAAVNDSIMHLLARHAPMAGSGESGLGQRNGRDGILKYCEPQTIMVSRLGRMARDVGWIGTPDKQNRLAQRALTWFYGR
jgi:acyl-CoA reductase-like NAD-dependent aldehyde dehydrogenase